MSVSFQLKFSLELTCQILIWKNLVSLSFQLKFSLELAVVKIELEKPTSVREFSIETLLGINSHYAKV